ncbi:hypothetical protein [Novipirellula artificiosorum]|nr:hypothetical protein [Novipirellula artificiosorum]
MRLFRSAIRFSALLALIAFIQAAPTWAESIAGQATHKQVGVIAIADEGNPLPINAFCLDQSGTIVVACGQGPGEIRLVNDDGEILKAWEMDVKPEAVNVAEDGTILVGGEGKLFRFDAEGKQLQQADSPHAMALRAKTDQLRKEAIARLTRGRPSLASQVQLYEGMVEQIEEKKKTKELNAQEERLLELLPDMIRDFKEKIASQEEEEGKKGNQKDEGPSEEAISKQIDMMLRSKMKISSVTSCGDQVFVATGAATGYGYCIWKTDADFAGGELVVEGLRGCCGQMDVQGCKEGLYVAENSRFRVVHFDVEGAEITSWGERDREGLDGFTSCCNPMNVCFNANGDVFTAEASTGRIKRFTSDGEFLSYVGDVDLVPGCKNVSIAVSPDNDKVYMLDLTRNHIVKMQARPEGEIDSEPTETDEGSEKPAGTAAQPQREKSLSGALLDSLLSVLGGGS